MRYTWTEYQQFIDSTPELEDQIDNLYLYSYFDTLQWGHRYTVVFNDIMLVTSIEYPYDYWDGAKTIYQLVMNNSTTEI